MLVSNTSTLVLLAKVNSLHTLLDDVKEIAIPKIVYKEFTSKDSFEVLSIKKEIEKKRIIMFDVDKKEYQTVIEQFKLDDGEAAAYALYRKNKGKAILTDDKELIKLCKIENAPFICAMGAVVRLYSKNKVTKEKAQDVLKRLYGYGRYSEDIYDFFKAKVM